MSQVYACYTVIVVLVDKPGLVHVNEYLQNLDTADNAKHQSVFCAMDFHRLVDVYVDLHGYGVLSALYFFDKEPPMPIS